LPRYFLDICYDGVTVEDDDGFMFTDLAAARMEAERALREVVANCIRESRPLAPRCVEIRRDDGDIAGVILLKDVLPPDFMK
jgi:hypothetical protein